MTKDVKTDASMITAGNCPPVHMIVARASTKLPGTGVIGILALLVLAQQQEATLESIKYPVVLAPYAPSSGAGTQANIQAINAMAKICPNTKLVPMG
jgi:acetylxylan esterase